MSRIVIGGLTALLLVVTAQLLTQSLSIDIITRAVFGVEGNDRVKHFVDTLLAYGQAYIPLLAFAIPLRPLIRVRSAS